MCRPRPSRCLVVCLLLGACSSPSASDGEVGDRLDGDVAGEVADAPNDEATDSDSGADALDDIAVDTLADTPDDGVLGDVADADGDADASVDDGADGDLEADTAVDVPLSDAPPLAGYSLRFFGEGGTYDDRVRIRLDDPELDDDPGPAVDVGATDFTIEFFLRARAVDNANTVNCGAGIGWVTSNIVIDRDRHSQVPTFGIGLSDGAPIFAVCNASDSCHTLCGEAPVTDGAWHHVAVQRALSGPMAILVDGSLDVSFAGPSGDISYPDDGEPLAVCPAGLCDYSDPFLVFGAEKHGYGDISFSGFLDEVRVSTTLRYGTTYAVPTAPFEPDASTVGLYHFDTGSGALAFDSATVAGGPSHGEIRVGGEPAGPVWSSATPFE